jgi:hypothetical protein
MRVFIWQTAWARSDLRSGEMMLRDGEVVYELWLNQ